MFPNTWRWHRKPNPSTTPKTVSFGGRQVLTEIQSQERSSESPSSSSWPCHPVKTPITTCLPRHLSAPWPVLPAASSNIAERLHPRETELPPPNTYPQSWGLKLKKSYWQLESSCPQGAWCLQAEITDFVAWLTQSQNGTLDFQSALKS